MKVLKWLTWLIIPVLILVVTFGVLSYFWLRHYIYSPYFQDDLVEIGNKELEGEFNIEGLDPENWGVKADRVTLYNSGKIAEIEIKDFQTYFSKWSFFKRSWQMKSIVCEDLTVHITRKKKDLKKKKAEEAAQATWNPYPDEPEKEKKKKSKDRPLISGMVPDDFQFGRVAIKTCDGFVERKRRDVSWDGVSLEGKISDNTLKARLGGGMVTVPLKILPNWKVNAVDLSINEDRFKIFSSDFTQEHGGTAKISGTGDLEGDHLDLEGEFDSIPISSLVDEPKFTTLQGRVNGSIKAINEGDDTLVKGKLFLSDGALILPPVLKPILGIIGEDQEKPIQLHRAVGDVKHIGDLTTIDNLYIESEGLFSVSGRVELINDFYRGAVQFGVSEKAYQKLPDAIKKQMSKDSSGFYRMPVRLEGKEEDFMSDLTLKLAKSMGSSFMKENDVLNSIERTVIEVMGDDKILEPVKDKADDLIKKGINELEKLFK